MTPTSSALKEKLEQLIAKWRTEAKDAKKRGYPESCVQQQIDANDLEELLSGVVVQVEIEHEQQTEP